MNQSRSLTIFVHIVGWLLLFVLIISFTANSPEGQDAWRKIFAPAFLSFYIIYITIFYLNAELLIPKLYLRKKYLLYFIAVILLFVLVILLRPFDHILNTGTPHQEMRPPPGEMGSREKAHPVDIVSIVLFIMTWSFSTALQIIKQWRTSERRALHAERDKANAELSFLKAQINPHFLFNTLNNIYSMAVSKSADTPTAIMKLSNIMRYVTDEAGHDFVPLSDEVNCVSDYIDLQKMRLSEKVKVDFSVSGELNEKRIAPLILMTFIENAFKYGISSHQATVVTIKLDVKEKNIDFFCQNKIFNAFSAERTGVGINNAKKRLEHLYPDRYSLNISKENEIFTVQLTLQLQ